MDNPRNEPLKFKKEKHPSFWRNVTCYLYEYSVFSTVHCVKYIGEKRRTILERLVWLVMLILSLYCCTYLVVKTYEKWDQSPVIVTFAHSPKPIWNIPFPAISICSETKCRRSVYNFTQAYRNLTDNRYLSKEEQKKFEEITLICDNYEYHNGSDFIGYDTIDFLNEVAPSIDEALYQCQWLRTNQTCGDLFVKTLTDEGICWTFNMLQRDELYTDIVYHKDKYPDSFRNSEWSLEGGYAKDLGANVSPKRAISAGRRGSLMVLLKSFDYDSDFICRGPVQGYKVVLHHPAEVPRVSQQYFRAPLNQEIIVAIKPDMMTTFDGLRNYDPHRRQCFFQSERSLSFFKVYTQQNCEIECLTNFTLKMCGCVAYHMPHREETKICGPRKVACMDEAQQEYVSKQVKSGLKQQESKTSATDVQDCDCLPSCTSLSYNAETSQADFNWPKVFEAYKANFSELPGVQFVKAFFFFKEQQFINSERNELYGPTDFFSNCGGLLGLFMGFSVLSMIEILYFLTLRVICNVRMYGYRFWSGHTILSADSTCSC